MKRLWHLPSAGRAPVAAVVTLLLAFSGGVAQAQYGLGSVLGSGGGKFANSDSTNGGTAGSTGSAPTIAKPPESPVDEFTKQLEDFQKSVPDLNKRIQDSAGAIDSSTDVDKAKTEIDGLRDEVSTLLAAVSNNGPVSQLGIRALDHIRAKLKALSTETRFKPDERQYLIDQWQRLQAQTETANKELDDARAQFAGLLQTLQSNEDFISELIEIRQAEKALDVIRSLSHDIRDASTQLNKLIGSIKPPGA
jgi:DNA repair exonuclease SbcCD ATPase subunit